MSHKGNFQYFWRTMILRRIMVMLCWRGFLLLYLGIGCGALAIVFLIEAQFFRQFTNQPMLAYALAGILECAKVGTSLMTQALAVVRRVRQVRMPSLLQAITALFQTAVILLSVLCCVMVVTAVLNGTLTCSLENREFVLRAHRSEPASIGLPHPMIVTAIGILRESFGIDVKVSVCISVFALFISGLLQSAIYIVFGHLLATQTDLLEYVFRVNAASAQAKKNCTPNS